MQSPNSVKGLQLQQMQIEEGRDQKNPFQVNPLWTRMTRGCGRNHQSSSGSFSTKWLKKEKRNETLEKLSQQAQRSIEMKRKITEEL